MKNFKLIKNNNDNDDFEIIITNVQLMVKKTRQKYKTKKLKNETNNNNSNVNSLQNYFKNLTDSTRKCINILIEKYNVNENQIKHNNIYCPLHENKNTSKSPSGKFNIKFNSYTCFSSKCPIKKTKPKGTISSIDFLKYITKLN